MAQLKANQNIYDLTDLDKLKDFLRENNLPLDTSVLPIGTELNAEGTNRANACADPEDLKCANDCWLCDGTWSAERYWYADCVWNTV